MTAPALVHVWASSWEFECCYPDAGVGEEWTAPVSLANAPWWLDYAQEPSDDDREFGVTRADGFVGVIGLDAHGDSSATISGRVARIQAVSYVHELDQRLRMYVPIALDGVEDRPSTAHAGADTTVDDDPMGRGCEDFLIDLEVDPAVLARLH